MSLLSAQGIILTWNLANSKKYNLKRTKYLKRAKSIILPTVKGQRENISGWHGEESLSLGEAEDDYWKRHFKGAAMKDFGHIFESWLCHSTAVLLTRSEVHCSFIFKVIVSHQIYRAASFYNFIDQECYEWAGFRKSEMMSIRDRNKKTRKCLRCLWETWWVICGRVITWKGVYRLSTGMKLKDFILRREAGWCALVSEGRDAQ